MKDMDKLTEHLPVFVPAVVSAAMATCEAAAIGRSLRSDEIIEISNRVEYAIMQYLTKLMQSGIVILEPEREQMANDIKNAIFENAWLMIQLATEEAKQRIKDEL